MIFKHFLPVFTLVASFPFFAQSQCTLSVNLGAKLSICRGEAKTLTANTTGGVSPYTYAWSHSTETAPSVSVTQSNTYSVTVTDANNCTANNDIVVTVLDTANFTLEIRPDTALFLSCNNKNVIVKALPDGVLPVSDFKWSTGAISLQFITVYEPNTYAVTVTANNGCESRKALTVTENKTPPNVSILPVPNPAILNCNVSQVLLDAISTTPSVVFRWHTNAVTSSIYATTAGIHTVTASNPEFGGGNGCSATAQIDVKNSNPTVNLGQDRTIQSGQNATLTASVSSGVAPFFYAWSTGATTPSVSVNTSGNFSVTVTDANGCTASDTVAVTLELRNSLIINAGRDATTCKNVAKIFTANVSNGVAPYTYAWSTGATTPSVSPTISGNFSVTITDASGATGSDTVALTVLDTANFTLEIRPDTALFLSCNNKNVLVKALPDGVLPVSDFKWSTGAISLQFITVYEPNTYAVTVTANNGCESRKALTVTENKTPPNVSILPVPNPAILNCNVSQVLLDAISTTPSVVFRWHTNAVTSSIYATTAGIHTVTASNPEFGGGNGCSATAQIDVKNNNPTVNLGQDRTIQSGQNATLTASVSSGVAPFFYAWSTGATTPSVSVNTSGNFSVTVTDANGCTASDTVAVTVTGGCDVRFNVNQVNNYCYGLSVGSIYVAQINGGGAPFQYSFDGGVNFSTNPYFLQIPAGTYVVVVKDANGCTATKTIVITEGPKINFTTTTTPTCNNTGTIRIRNASGGNGRNYDYFVTNLPFGHRFYNTWTSNSTFNDLPPNTYFVKVRDEEDCGTQPPVAVVVGAITGFSTTITGHSTVCFGGTTPLNAPTTGGNAPFSYYWIKPDASTATTATIQAGVGNYFVTITDRNGCTATAAKTVVGAASTLILTLDSLQNPLCNGSTNGRIFTTASGGTGSTTFTRTNFTTSQTRSDFSNLAPNTYQIQAKDANGCLSNTVSATIIEPSVITFSTSKTDVLCRSGADGAISVIATGGVNPLSYSRDNGNTWQPTALFTELSAGNYRIRVRDAHNCTTASQTVNILQPTNLTFGTTTSGVTCNAGVDGEIVIRNASGGNGLAYQFSKDNGASWQNSGIYGNVSAGIYAVKIRDVKGCTSAARSITVVEPAPITFATVVSDVTCGFNSNAVIGLTNVNGGTPQYRYSRNGGASFQVNQNFTNLIVGTYPIVVKDNKGCLSAVKNTAVANGCTAPSPLIQFEPTQRIPIVIAHLSPNPAAFDIVLQVKSLNKRVQQFDFIDVLGRTVTSEKRELDGGLNRVSFDVSQLPQGTYFIQTLGGGEGKGQPRKFVKM